MTSRIGVSVVVAGMMLLAGCQAVEPDAAGAGGAGAGAGQGDGGVVVESAPGADEGDGASGADKNGGSNAPAVGTIEFKVERDGAAPDVITVPATECYVGDDAVRAVGAVSGASATIDAVPDVLLHERTGTWQARGAAVVTIGSEVFTADARPINYGSSVISSSYDYRINGNYAEFRMAWWPSGTATLDTAGYVHITCD